MIHDYSICYIIIDTPSGYSTFLRGSIYSAGTIAALHRINELPISIPELLSSQEDSNATRLDSLYPGRVVKLTSSYQEAIEFPYAFKVVIITTPLPESLALSTSALHYSAHDLARSKSTPNICDLSTEALRDYFFANLQEAYQSLRDLPDNFSVATNRSEPHLIHNNILTHSNILCLKSAGVNVEHNTNHLTEDATIAEAKKSIDLISTLIETSISCIPTKIRIPSAHYLISDFSIDLEYSINYEKYKKHTLKKSSIENYSDVSDAVVFARSKTDIDEHNENTLIQSYKNEVYFSSLVNSIYSSSTLTPEIKIKLTNNETYPIVSDMGVNIRNGRTDKLHKQSLKFTNHVLRNSHDLLNKLFDSQNKHLKIISNFPIEWTNVGGLPLMIRHNTSRIFATPAYIKEEILSNNQEYKLTLGDLKKTLIITSFRNNDRIGQDIAQALEKNSSKFKDDEFKLKVQQAQSHGAYISDFEPEFIQKNVSSKSELVAALNEASYAIAIFDMHGHHDLNDQGYLQLSDGPLSPRELIGVANIPPIIILSACDTSPADRSHYNVANAFLSAGAVTTLASTYPILSKDAARYIVRLYNRLRLYLPEKINHRKESVRWSEFITGINRRVYFHSFLIHIHKKYKIPTTIINELEQDINHILEIFPDSFLEKIIYSIGLSTDLTSEEISKELSTQFTFAECMNYVQIGSPEKILIHAADLSGDDYPF